MLKNVLPELKRLSTIYSFRSDTVPQIAELFLFVIEFIIVHDIHLLGIAATIHLSLIMTEVFFLWQGL